MLETVAASLFPVSSSSGRADFIHPCVRSRSRDWHCGGDNRVFPANNGLEEHSRRDLLDQHSSILLEVHNHPSATRSQPNQGLQGAARQVGKKGVTPKGDWKLGDWLFLSLN